MWSLWRAALYGMMLQALANSISPGTKYFAYLGYGSFEGVMVFFFMSLPGPLLFVFIAWVHNKRVKKPQTEITT